MKPIRLSRHALSKRESRGFSEEEVEEAIRNGPWAPAKAERQECYWDLPYNDFWNGKRYAVKRIRAIFVEEPDAIAVVTVITYYIRRSHDETRLRP